MVFKRYIYKNGKRLGPYYYKNVRDKNGKVKTIYLGTKNPEEKAFINNISDNFEQPKVGVYRTREEKREEIKESIIPSFSIRANLIITLLLLIFLIWINFSDTDLKEQINKLNGKEIIPFELDQAIIRGQIRQGDELTKEIRISNLGYERSIRIENNLELLNSENEIYLGKGQSKNLRLNIRSRDDARGVTYNAGVYSGKLSFISENYKKDISVAIEIESESVLIDANLNIFEREIEAGDNLELDITLFNLMNNKNIKARMYYFVKDLDDNIIISSDEEVVLGDKASFSKSLLIPENINEGRYVAGVIVNYGSSYGTASYFFDIVEKRESAFGKLKSKPVYLVIVVLALALLLILTSYVHYWIGSRVHKKMHGKRSKFIVIFILLLVLFMIYRIGLLYKEELIGMYINYWPIVKDKLVYLLNYLPYKNPLFYPVLEIIVAFLIIILVLVMHRRKTNIDLRNYILVKKLIKIIKKEENEHRKRELYKKALNLYRGLSGKRRKKLEGKIIKLSKVVKDEN